MPINTIALSNELSNVLGQFYVAACWLDSVVLMLSGFDYPR